MTDSSAAPAEWQVERVAERSDRSTDRPDHVGPREPPDAALHLIRRLAESVERVGDHGRRRDMPGGDEILLDHEVDGVRCVLIRRVRSVDQDPSTPVLSPREHEIARMVARGYPNKTIASVLEISSFTVSTHLRRIFAKLGVTSRAAMVAHLMDDRLIQLCAAGGVLAFSSYLVSA